MQKSMFAFMAAALGAFAVIFTLMVKDNFQEEKRVLISPPPMLEKFVFGYNEPMADALWIRAIQDFDYCEEKDKNKNCKGSSWLYSMLDTITNLSPKYRIAYATGGVALSVIISDTEGATKLFDKAEKEFPTDWKILYSGSYHALYEEHDRDKAARRLIAAAKNGGGEWFYSLAARLYTENGERELGLKLYNDLKNSGLDPIVLKRMRDKLNITD